MGIFQYHVSFQGSLYISPNHAGFFCFSLLPWFDSNLQEHLLIRRWEDMVDVFQSPELVNQLIEDSLPELPLKRCFFFFFWGGICVPIQMAIW